MPSGRVRGTLTEPEPALRYVAKHGVAAVFLLAADHSQSLADAAYFQRSHQKATKKDVTAHRFDGLHPVRTLEMPVDSLVPPVPRLSLGGHQFDARDQLTCSSKASLQVNASSSRDEVEMLHLYHQAMPLVHAQSTAVIKTLKKMLPSGSDVPKRMLSRTVHSVVADSQSGCHLGMKLAGNRCDGKWSRRQLEFVAVCERIVQTFSVLNGEGSEARGVPKTRMRELLQAFELHVEDAAYRQWEQSIPDKTTFVSVRMLVQACRLWFSARFLIEHVNARLPPASNNRDNGKKTPGEVASGSSGPRCDQLVDHPFSKMTRESESAAAFNYREYADLPPTVGVAQSMAGRTSADAGKCGKRHALSSSASAPAIPVASSAHLPSRQLHQTHLTPVGSSAAPVKENERQRRLRVKLERARDTDMARAFSASVAMISRHVQNEEMHDARDALRERQLAKVDDQRHWDQVHRAHCQALADDRARQQQQQVAAMKTLAVEEQQLTREFAAMRQDLLRRNRLEQPFSLSASTSTMFQHPPEILAARATAKTLSEKKHLRFIEREHLDHMRSLQLLDFVFDKKHAVLEAMKPKADAALVNLGDEGQADELPMAEVVARDELWRELLQQEAAAGGDLAAFVPPANSPPAALRFFGASRPIALPAFASNAPRDLS